MILSLKRLKIGLPLVVVGDGRTEKFKKIASQKSIFAVCKENELRPLYNAAEALIFPQVEDFGLSGGGAQACGTPVIAFNGGGAKSSMTGLQEFCSMNTPVWN